VATLIDGKAISKLVREEVARGVEVFKVKYSRVPGLHVVLVGEDPASTVYVRNKEKAALEVGIAGQVHRLPASTTEEALLGLVKELNQSGEVDGILVQFPVPQGIRQQKVVEATAPSKDVDGLHPESIGALWAGIKGLVPCTPRGCMRLIAETGIKVDGAQAVVVGRSNLVGKPIAGLLLAANATVTLAHSKTRDFAAQQNDPRLVDQARRGGDRRGHEPRRSGQAVRGRGLRICVRGCFGDHTRARWGRANDYRDVAGKHAPGSECPHFARLPHAGQLIGSSG